MKVSADTKKLTGKTDMVPEINSRLEAFAKEEGIAYINPFSTIYREGNKCTTQ